MIIKEKIIKFEKSKKYLSIPKIDIKQGLYLVEGDNGCGKSTFLKYLTNTNSNRILCDESNNNVTYIGQEIDLFFCYQ